MKSLSRIPVSRALSDARKQLIRRFPDEYKTDSVVLLCHVLQKSKDFLYTHSNYLLTDLEQKAYNKCLSKRIEGMPVAYIVGKCEFMGLDFFVDERVLIPRSDTEIMTELAIKYARTLENPKILDVCTGSGCLAVSLARFLKDAVVVGLDISSDALAVANRNAEALGVSHRVTFLESDLFSSLDEYAYAGYFDLIVSNPPYIPHAQISTLMLSVRNFEPHLALDGGSRGLDFYQKIIAQCGKYLKNGGMLYFEIGYDQAEEVTALMEQNEFFHIELTKDYAHFDRVLGGIKCSTD